MAQYTTRQEYRYTDDLYLGTGKCQTLFRVKGCPQLTNPADGFVSSTPQEPPQSSVIKSLADLEHRLFQRENVPVIELRESLRQAATLLCRSNSDHNAVLAYFVRIPFLVFSKQAIKVGLSELSKKIHVWNLES